MEKQEEDFYGINKKLYQKYLTFNIEIPNNN